MRKLALFLALLVLATALTACGKEPQTITAWGLTVTLPGEYLDLSAEAAYTGFALAYGEEGRVVTALKEPFSRFRQYGLELDLQGYAELNRQAYGVAEAVAPADGLVTFQYTDGEITWLVGLYQGSDAFWLVKAGCPTGEFKKTQEDFTEILKSVQVG